MYFNRPVVKMEVKRSMRQTRPHPMLVTLLYLVIAGAGVWLISWLMTTLFPSRIDLDSLRYYLLIGNNYYGPQLFSWIVQTMLVSLVVSILTTAWNGLMNTGYSGYCLNMSQNMNPPLERIFSGFSRAGTVILAYILVAVFTFLWNLLFTVGLILVFVVAALLAASSNSMAALSVLLIFAAIIFYFIAAVWVSYRYVMVPFVLADSQGPASAMDAIRASTAMMRGRKGSFLVLRLSFIGWYLLEVLAVAVGVIIAAVSMAGSIRAMTLYNFSRVNGFGGIAVVILVALVCGVGIFILELWLRPYRTGCEAHFYLYASGGIQPNPYQPGPYGGQPGPYGGQPGPYSSQPGPYGGQPGPYSSQPGPYGSQPGPYGGQPGPYSSQPGPYGSQPGPYGSQPGPYGSQPGPYSYNPYSYQPPSQSTSGGYAQGPRPSQYGAAQWGAPQTPQAPQAPVLSEPPKFPETVIAPVFDQPPAAPDDAPAEPDDAPYEAPYAEPDTPNDDDTRQQPVGPGDPQI